MNIVTLVVSGFLFVLHIFVGQPTPTPPPIHYQPTTTITPSETPTNTIAASPTPTHPAATPTKNPSSPSSTGSLDTWKYPHATVTNTNNNEMTLQSSDDAATITTWYDNQLKSQGYHSVSQAKTNTNGNILNKLAASNNGQQVNISIQKNSDTATVTITVALRTDSDNNSVHIEIKNSK